MRRQGRGSKGEEKESEIERETEEKKRRKILKIKREKRQGRMRRKASAPLFHGSVCLLIFDFQINSIFFCRPCAHEQTLQFP